MATRAYAPEPVISLPPVLAFSLGVPAAPRSAVDAMIERMIEALDQIDGDPDCEEMTRPRMMTRRAATSQTSPTTATKG